MRGPARIVLVVIALVVAGIAAGLTSQDGSPKAKSPRVVFSLYYNAGNSLDDASGVVCAGWDDGFVVFAADWRKPGKDMHKGAITPSQLEWVLDELHGAGFFDESISGGALYPCGSSFSIGATRTGKTSRRTTADLVHPGQWSNVETPQAEYRFEKMWTMSRMIMRYAVPQTFTPVGNDKAVEQRLGKARNAGDL